MWPGPRALNAAGIAGWTSLAVLMKAVTHEH
jgi:hypothetical protein